MNNNTLSVPSVTPKKALISEEVLHLAGQSKRASDLQAIKEAKAELDRLRAETNPVQAFIPFSCLLEVGKP